MFRISEIPEAIELAQGALKGADRFVTEASQVYGMSELSASDAAGVQRQLGIAGVLSKPTDELTDKLAKVFVDPDGSITLLAPDAQHRLLFNTPLPADNTIANMWPSMRAGEAYSMRVSLEHGGYRAHVFNPDSVFGNSENSSTKVVMTQAGQKPGQRPSYYLEGHDINRDGYVPLVDAPALLNANSTGMERILASLRPTSIYDHRDVINFSYSGVGSKTSFTDQASIYLDQSRRPEDLRFLP